MMVSGACHASTSKGSKAAIMPSHMHAAWSTGHNTQSFCHSVHVALSNSGWLALQDGGNQNETIGLRQEFIYADNIVSLFNKYSVPMRFDQLTVSAAAVLEMAVVSTTSDGSCMHVVHALASCTGCLSTFMQSAGRHRLEYILRATRNIGSWLPTTLINSRD